MELLTKKDGSWAAINGATQVRAGAVRPEVIIFPNRDDSQEQPLSPPSASSTKELALGAKVRLIRVPYFGQFGTVHELPNANEQIPTGAFTRVVRVSLEEGEEVVTIPRANIELV